MTRTIKTDADLLEIRDELSKWQTAADFVKKVAELGGEVDSQSLFNRTKYKFLLNAMVLAEFVQLREFEFVHLVDEKDQWPDGQVGTKANPVNVEITEVQEPGRRRGEEYRGADSTRLDPVEDWRARSEKIPAALDQAILKKVRKNYSSQSTLVVYLNISEYDLLQTETETAIANSKRKYHGSFEEIYVIWKSKLY